MPHVVKPWPGKSKEQKRRLAEAITKDVTTVLNYGEESVSVALEEVKSQDWGAKVYNQTSKKTGTSSTRSLDTLRSNSII